MVDFLLSKHAELEFPAPSCADQEQTFDGRLENFADEEEEEKGGASLPVKFIKREIFSIFYNFKLHFLT